MSDHYRAARGASAPGLSPSGPRTCQSFGDEQVAERATTAQDDSQLASVLVFIAIADCRQGELTLVEKHDKPITGFDAQIVFIVALRLRDLGRIDIGNPDLHALEPDRVAINDAGPTNHVADREFVLLPCLSRGRARYLVDANKPAEHANKETAGYEQDWRPTTTGRAVTDPGMKLDDRAFGVSAHDEVPTMPLSIQFKRVWPSPRLAFLAIFGYLQGNEFKRLAGLEVRGRPRSRRSACHE